MNMTIVIWIIIAALMVENVPFFMMLMAITGKFHYAWRLITLAWYVVWHRHYIKTLLKNNYHQSKPQITALMHQNGTSNIISMYLRMINYLQRYDDKEIAAMMPQLTGPKKKVINNVIRKILKTS